MVLLIRCRVRLVDVDNLLRDVPDKSDQNGMALDESWAITGQVDIGGDDAAAVAAHHLHRYRYGSLQATSYIATVPGKTEWDLRIDA